VKQVVKQVVNLVLPACEVIRAPNSLPMLVSWVQSLVLESRVGVSILC
jgi:hypothetical protein